MIFNLDCYDKQYTFSSLTNMVLDGVGISHPDTSKAVFGSGHHGYSNNSTGYPLLYNYFYDIYNSDLTKTTLSNAVKKINSAGIRYRFSGYVGNYAVVVGGRHTKSATSTDPDGRINNYTDIINMSTYAVTHPDVTSTFNAHSEGLSGCVGNYIILYGGTYGSGLGPGGVGAFNNSLTGTKLTAATGDYILREYHNRGSASDSTRVGNYVIFAGGYVSTSNVPNVGYAYNSSLTRTAIEISEGRVAVARGYNDNYAFFAGGGSLISGTVQVGNVVDAFDSNLTRTLASPLTYNVKKAVGGYFKGYFVCLGGSTLPDDSDSSNLIQTYDNNLVKGNKFGFNLPCGGYSEMNFAKVNDYILVTGGDVKSPAIDSYYYGDITSMKWTWAFNFSRFIWSDSNLVPAHT